MRNEDVVEACCSTGVKSETCVITTCKVPTCMQLKMKINGFLSYCFCNKINLIRSKRISFLKMGRVFCNINVPVRVYDL